jgi:NTP pyrophosphatase (non-canonical NTP hydrolase)
MMTLEEIQKTVDQWIRTYGVRYFDEMTNMVLLTEEVGELARLIARQFGEQSFKESEETTDVKTRIADEMADVFFVLTCLANQMDIDLTEAVRKNLEKKTRRDSDRHHHNKKLN